MKSATVFVACLSLLFAAIGCQSEIVASKGPRPATAPTSVIVYQKQPQKYEILGSIVLPITTDMNWDANGNATAAFDRMRAQAAALGANGLLLTLPDGDFDYKITAGDHNKFYQLCMLQSPKEVVAQAIYMLEPPSFDFSFYKESTW